MCIHLDAQGVDDYPSAGRGHRRQLQVRVHGRGIALHSFFSGCAALGTFMSRSKIADTIIVLPYGMVMMAVPLATTYLSLSWKNEEENGRSMMIIVSSAT